MTQHEYIKTTTPEQMAMLLTILVQGVLDVKDKDELNAYYKAFRAFMDEEVVMK